MTFYWEKGSAHHQADISGTVRYYTPTLIYYDIDTEYSIILCLCSNLLRTSVYKKDDIDQASNNHHMLSMTRHLRQFQILNINYLQ